MTLSGRKRISQRQTGYWKQQIRLAFLILVHDVYVGGRRELDLE